MVMLACARRHSLTSFVFRRASRSLRFSSTIPEKPYYVTTPIFYPNAAPHVGHLHSLVTADIFARHARLVRPHAPVHFLTGTDEHGLKIQQAARARGQDPQAFCDTLSVQFRDLCEKANISHTKFLRTSASEHKRAVEHLWTTLDAKGLLYKDTYEGWYAVADETFYTPAQIAPGVIPGTYVAVETGAVVEWTREENWKFRLSAFQPWLLEHFAAAPRVFPEAHQEWVLRTLREAPLEDLSVSRPRSRLEWGVPVPGDPDHTVYVWFDALMCYLSGLGYPWSAGGPSSGAAAAWPPNVQVVGKDIVRFHAIYFPAMLHALELPLPRTLLAHAHWTMGQRKMSKSVGNVADPLAAIARVGADRVRWYLARAGGRFRDDADWSAPQLDKHARELTDLLGNFFLRVASPAIARRVAGTEWAHSLRGDEARAVLDAATTERMDELATLGERVGSLMERLEVAQALDAVVHVLQSANSAMTALEPWRKDVPAEQTSYFLASARETLRIAGTVLQPFVPGAAIQLLDALGVPPDQRTWAHTGLEAVKCGQVQPVRLFEKIVE